MERTTNLMELKMNHPFTWGQVVNIHAIGEYSIVEYQPWKTDGCRLKIGDVDFENYLFHGYIDGKCTSRSWESLDAALVGLIAYKRDGPNTQAGEFFMKMVS